MLLATTTVIVSLITEVVVETHRVQLLFGCRIHSLLAYFSVFGSVKMTLSLLTYPTAQYLLCCFVLSLSLHVASHYSPLVMSNCGSSVSCS